MVLPPTVPKQGNKVPKSLEYPNRGLRLWVWLRWNEILFSLSLPMWIVYILYSLVQRLTDRGTWAITLTFRVCPLRDARNKIEHTEEEEGKNSWLCTSFCNGREYLQVYFLFDVSLTDVGRISVGDVSYRCVHFQLHSPPPFFFSKSCVENSEMWYYFVKTRL